MQYDWEDGAGPKDLAKCGASYNNGVVGGFGDERDLPLIIGGAQPVIDYTTLSSTVADASSMGGYQHACVIAQTSQALDGGQVLAIDYVYLTGDIKFTTR